MAQQDDEYLGFDLSTQKLKAVLLSSNLDVKFDAEVKFDADLSEFRTSGGVNQGQNEHEFFACPLMWIQAIDMVLDRLVKAGANFCNIVAISGSAQQHGSVYWSRCGISTLLNLDPKQPLCAQFDNAAFSIDRAPVWMDASTTVECTEMEQAVGGPTEMFNITGSKCYARFTGPQIRKIYKQHPEEYRNTERISLISSFLASIFLGCIAPIDYSDGSGMNLFDIKSKCWSPQCLNACAPDLKERLGEPVKSTDILGCLSSYFVDRFCFPNDCKVVAFTGDNPSALCGMLVAENWLVMSLGTSDTLMMNLEKSAEFNEGHVLCHPTPSESHQFMGLLCFRNGSLVRDDFKTTVAKDDWKLFSDLLDATPAGNNGNMAIHFQSMEIIPKAIGVLRWNQNHSSSSQGAAEGLSSFDSPEIDIRALIEGQIVHKRSVVEDLGFHFGNETKIIATGGASINKSILQVISDVFNASVYVQKNSESALIGAAYRAKYALYLDHCHGCAVARNDIACIPKYHDYIVNFIPNYLEQVCTPCANCQEIYTPMVQRYKEMEKILIAKS